MTPRRPSYPEIAPEDPHVLLLKSHEDRLQKIEDNLTEVTKKVLPSLARLEEIVTSGFKSFDERLKGIDEDHLRSQSRDATVDALKKVEVTRQHRYSAAKKWVAGVAMLIVAAAVAAHFGWSSK